jgi:glycosyltransferase involved in cell wall biosynthesis
MIHPVSVVVPHTKSRAEFFHAVCLPSIERNNPAQIIVVDRPGGACEKRNEGASKAMYDYLLFVDDDAELLPDAIEVALTFLDSDPGAAFAYGDRVVVDHTPPPKTINLPGVGWNLETLRRASYIDTTSLLRKKAFPGFDSSIKRFQDWDLWLTIAERGGRGIYVRRPLHHSHRIDRGISDTYDFEEHDKIIRAKHGLL